MVSRQIITFDRQIIIQLQVNSIHRQAGVIIFQLQIFLIHLNDYPN